MPLKWKLYYISNLYNTLYLGGCVGVLIYALVHDNNSFTDIWQMALTLIGFALIGLKSLLSLKIVSLYKNNRPYSKNERVMFIIGYCLATMLFILTFLFSAYFVYNIFVYPGYSGRFRPQDIFFSVVFISFFTLLYGIIFDFPLLKLVRNQQNIAIESIGTDIAETTI